MPRVTTPERFWALTDTAVGGCILWMGARDEKGYGRIGYAGRPRQRAHRVAWEITNGPITGGMCVLHRCDTPACVNPDHLFIGTQAENIADREAKGRSASPPSRRKLSHAQVVAIREGYRDGLTQQALADHFGISRGNVSKIVNGVSYVDA